MIADLGKRLDAYKTRPWWAEGQAVLAGFVEGRGLPGALVQARALAAAGAKAYPESLGGKRCRAIVARIEAPTYSIAGMASDGLRRQSLQVTHRNMSALHVRLYPVDLEAQLTRAHDYSLLPESRDMARLIATKPAVAWSVPLPATPDYLSHVTYVTPPVDKPGLYVIVASARADFQKTNNHIQGVTFLASGIVLVNERSNGFSSRMDPNDGVNGRVLDGESGQPVTGAEVLLYRYDYNAGHKVAATRKTDGHGLVTFPTTKDTGHQYFLVAKRGVDRAVDSSYHSFWRPDEPSEQTNALIYTDRSVYRPLQKLFFKAVVFHGRGDEARYRVVPARAVTVALRDANGEEVAKHALTTNAFGSVAGEFTLPAGRLLGGWSIHTDAGGQANVRVEEYKRPTFEVKLHEAKEALRLNRPATLTGEARYYFGLPVTGGAVRWRVTREPVYPSWWGWGGWAPPERTQIVADRDRTARSTPVSSPLTFTPRADERATKRPVPGRADVTNAAAISYRYRVVADVTEEGGETRSADRSFRLGWSASRRAWTPGSASCARRRRPGQGGAHEPGRRAAGGEGELAPRDALVQPSQTLLPAEQPPRPRADGATRRDAGRQAAPALGRWDVARGGSLARVGRRARSARRARWSHDAKGEAAVTLPALAPGAYRLQLRDDGRLRRGLPDQHRAGRGGRQGARWRCRRR